MSQTHLFSHNHCPNVQWAVIILSEKNIEYERTSLELENKHN